MNTTALPPAPASKVSCALYKELYDWFQIVSFVFCVVFTMQCFAVFVNILHHQFFYVCMHNVFRVNNIISKMFCYTGMLSYVLWCTVFACVLTWSIKTCSKTSIYFRVVIVSLKTLEIPPLITMVLFMFFPVWSPMWIHQHHYFSLWQDTWWIHRYWVQCYQQELWIAKEVVMQDLASGERKANLSDFFTSAVTTKE